LVTTSIEAYEELAVALARDPEKFAATKAKLMRNRDTEPLFDSVRFTRHLEAAFITMWERHLAGEPPVAFSIPAAAD
jgi:predicted O-linked N-acetylglucosamine transferase (SPINDLY family)